MGGGFRLVVLWRGRNRRRLSVTRGVGRTRKEGGADKTSMNGFCPRSSERDKRSTYKMDDRQAY